MFERIRRAWKVSKYPPDKLVELAEIAKEKEKLEGDGQAVFLGEGTHEEYEELKKEDSGLKAWYRRIGL